MKQFAILLAASFIATSAFAQSTTIIKKERSTSAVEVEDEDDADVTVKRRVTTTGNVGCSSKTVEKTDALGGRTTKSKTNC